MDEVEQAVDVMRAGGVLIFPTDTVWGVGAWMGSQKGISKLYSLKKRNENKPTAILVGSLDQAMEYGEFDDKSRELVNTYWPGALTVIVKAKTNLPHQVINEAGGVGLRWPKYELLNLICNRLPGGVVASSANEAGFEAPLRLDMVDEKLLVDCDLVIRREIPLSGKASTVVDLMGSRMKIIRQGEITIEEGL